MPDNLLDMLDRYWRWGLAIIGIVGTLLLTSSKIMAISNMPEILAQHSQDEKELVRIAKIQLCITKADHLKSGPEAYTRCLEKAEGLEP